ncbi:MAG: cytochrome P450 [Polyangiaceae bacterium]|nr:cytochrome P450 [Polyangiaceae bacterium]
MALPPGPSEPAFVQLLRFTFQPLEFFEDSLARYGDPFTLRLTGLGTFVLVTAPDLLKQVFTADANDLTSGSANKILEPVTGPRSLLLLDGAEHLRMRRLLLPPLHGERMHAYAETMAKAANEEVQRFPSGRPFSLHPHMQAITLEVILRAVFGLDERSRLERLSELLTKFMEPPPAIFAFLPALQRDFPLSPMRIFMRRREAVDRELYALIDERQKHPDDSRTDVLALLLAARDEEGKPLTRGELRDELVTMLVAGHETTATSLSWTIACLLENPGVLERLEAELAPFIEKDGSIDVAAVVRAEYLDAVVKESLRLRPIVPDVVREVRVPYNLAGYDLPLGVFLTPCIYLAHRQPDVYPNPTRFLPERWIGVKPDPYRWFPFGGGIRRCIGMAFALYEMKVVLATILARTRLRLTQPVKVVRRTLTLAPSRGTEVELVERRRVRAG